MLEKKNPSIQFSARDKIQPWNDDIQSTFFPASIFSKYSQIKQCSGIKTSNPFFTNKIKRQVTRWRRNQIISDPILIRNQTSDHSKTQNVSPQQKPGTPKAVKIASTKVSPQRTIFSMERQKDDQQGKCQSKTFIHSHTLNKFKNTKLLGSQSPQFAYYMNRSSTKLGSIIAGKTLKMPRKLQMDQLRIGNSKSAKSVKRMEHCNQKVGELKQRRLTQPINNVTTGLLIQRKLYLLAHQQQSVSRLKKILNPALF